MTIKLFSPERPIRLTKSDTPASLVGALVFTTPEIIPPDTVIPLNEAGTTTLATFQNPKTAREDTVGSVAFLNDPVHLEVNAEQPLVPVAILVGEDYFVYKVVIYQATY